MGRPVRAVAAAFLAAAFLLAGRAAGQAAGINQWCSYGTHNTTAACNPKTTCSVRGARRGLWVEAGARHSPRPEGHSSGGLGRRTIPPAAQRRQAAQAERGVACRPGDGWGGGLGIGRRLACGHAGRGARPTTPGSLYLWPPGATLAGDPPGSGATGGGCCVWASTVASGRPLCSCHAGRLALRDHSNNPPLRHKCLGVDAAYMSRTPRGPAPSLPHSPSPTLT